MKTIVVFSALTIVITIIVFLVALIILSQKGKKKDSKPKPEDKKKDEKKKDEKKDEKKKGDGWWKKIKEIFKTIFWVALFVGLVTLIGTCSLGAYKDLEQMNAKNLHPSQAQTRAWTSPMLYRLTKSPTIVPWPKGAIRYTIHLAPGEPDRDRKVSLKCGGKAITLGANNGPGFDLPPGDSPIELSSKDGKPLGILLSFLQ